jgi:hypothetical protein
MRRRDSLDSASRSRSTLRCARPSNDDGGERWLGERLEQRGAGEGVVGVEGERATDVADRGGAQGWLGVAGRRARGDERLVRGVGGRGGRLAAAGEAAIAVEVGIDRRGEVSGGGRTRGGIAAGRTP